MESSIRSPLPARRARVFLASNGFAIVASLWLFALGCGGPGAVDPQAPPDVSGLERQQMLEGEAAKTLIDELHTGAPATTEAWVASYGEGDRIWIQASAFPTPEAATTALNMMRAMLARGTDQYAAIESANIAQQAGWRTRDEDGKFGFVFVKGRWMIGIRAIAPDLEPAVYEIDWVPAE